MAPIVQWFNLNQGFSFSILTLAYVLCTIAIVWAMKKTNELSAHNLEQAIQLEQRRSRPYVIFDIQLGADYLLRAVLQNIGLTAAYQVKVSCEPALVNTFCERESVLVSETVEFLAPQRILEDTLESFDLDRPAISDHRIYKIVISYRDADGSQSRETFTVDRYIEMERTILDADLRNKAIDQLSKRISKLTDSGADLEGQLQILRVFLAAFIARSWRFFKGES